MIRLNPERTCLDDLGAGLHRDSHGRWSGLVQEIRVVFDGNLLVLDVAEQGLDFFEPDRIGFAAVSGFLEVPGECATLDFQDIEAAFEILACRLADFGDFFFEFFQLGFDFQNLLLKQRQTLRMDDIHGMKNFSFQSAR